MRSGVIGDSASRRLGRNDSRRECALGKARRIAIKVDESNSCGDGDGVDVYSRYLILSNVNLGPEKPMENSEFLHHFPTFGRFVLGLISGLNWFVVRLYANARVFIAIALLIAFLFGCREYVVHTQRDVVAEIQGAGGSVSYEWDWRNGQPLRSRSPGPWQKWLASELGPDLFGQVVSVDLHGHGGDNVSSLLQRVARLSRLEFLSLANTGVTDEGLASLRDLTGLKALRLQGTKVRGSGLAHLEHMVELEELMLPNAPISDAEIAHLAGLTKLKRLRFSGRGLTNAGLVHLAAMRQMEDLRLRQTAITTLEPIRAMTQLKFLDLNGSTIDDGGLKPVAGFTNLEQLWLCDTAVSDAGIAHLVGLPNLKRLELVGTDVTDIGLSLLCNLPQLSYLNLHDTKVTDAGLADKLSVSSFRELVVSGPHVTPAKLDLLRATFPGMRIRGEEVVRPQVRNAVSP